MLINQQRSIRDRHDIRNLIRRGADDRLQTHFAQQTHAFDDAFAVHLVECLIEHDQTHRVAELDYAHAIQLRERGQNRNIERRLRLAARLGVERLRQQLLGAVLIGGLQIELQIGAEVGVPLDVLLQLTLLAGVSWVSSAMVIWLNSLSISGPYFS